MTPYDDASLLSTLPFIMAYKNALDELYRTCATSDFPELQEMKELLEEHWSEIVPLNEAVDSRLDDVLERLETMGYDNG